MLFRSKVLNLLSCWGDHVLTCLFDCSKCDNKYQDKAGLKHHIESKHSGLKFKCYDCATICSSKYNLRRHVLDVHKGSMRSNHQKKETSICIKCDKEVLTKSLKSHIREVHQESKSFKCDVVICLKEKII